MVICIDADKTIFENDGDYRITGIISGAKEFINNLYDRGDIIIIWSSRNSLFFGKENYNKCMQELEDKLNEYGIKYDFIDDGRFGKLPADLYIDDKAVPFYGKWDEKLQSEIEYRRRLLGTNTFDDDYIDFLSELYESNLSDSDKLELLEYTIKQIRARASKKAKERAEERAVEFVGFKDDKAEFLAKGGADNYAIIIRFLDFLDVIEDDKYKTARDKALAILEGDVEVYCSCPWYLYGGYQWYGTQRGYNVSEYPEHRPPQPHKPDGWICKHLVVALRSLPFYSSELAKYIKDNFM